MQASYNRSRCTLPQSFLALRQQKSIVAMISTATIGLYRFFFNHFQAWAMSCQSGGRSLKSRTAFTNQTKTGWSSGLMAASACRIMWMCRWLR
jgi:hypothetical protein